MSEIPLPSPLKRVDKFTPEIGKGETPLDVQFKQLMQISNESSDARISKDRVNLIGPHDEGDVMAVGMWNSHRDLKDPSDVVALFTYRSLPSGEHRWVYDGSLERRGEKVVTNRKGEGSYLQNSQDKTDNFDHALVSGTWVENNQGLPLETDMIIPTPHDMLQTYCEVMKKPDVTIQSPHHRFRPEFNKPGAGMGEEQREVGAQLSKYVLVEVRTIPNDLKQY